MNALITIVVVALLTMFLGLRKAKKAMLPVIFTGLAIAFITNLLEWNNGNVSFPNMMVVDNFSVAFNGVMIFTTILVFMFAGNYYRSIDRPLEDIYSLMLFALCGAIVMTSFSNLTMLFIGIEILSISMYILAGSKKFDLASNEAALKYFLTGSFATGFLLFGISLIYGATGSFNLDKISEVIINEGNRLPQYFKVGLLLTMVGLAFKLAVAPFHFWAPDVYHGSPTLITAYMSTVVKTAGIAAFYKLFAEHFYAVKDLWSDTLWIFSIVTILTGNLIGLYQRNMKRLLAYSSISHAGYLLMAIVAVNALSANALLLYSAAYSIATILAFGIIIIVRDERKNDDIETFNGLGKTNPYMSLGMTVALLSLTGIPPLAGFAAKYYIFTTAMQDGYLWLVILALLGSVVSAVYYFKPIIAIYFKEGSWPPIPVTASYRFEIIFNTVVTLLLGLMPWVLMVL